VPARPRGCPGGRVQPAAQSGRPLSLWSALGHPHVWAFSRWVASRRLGLPLQMGVPYPWVSRCPAAVGFFGVLLSSRGQLEALQTFDIDFPSIFWARQGRGSLCHLIIVTVLSAGVQLPWLLIGEPAQLIYMASLPPLNV